MSYYVAVVGIRSDQSALRFRTERDGRHSVIARTPSRRNIWRLVVIAAIQVLGVFWIANFWNKGHLFLCGLMIALWIFGAVGLGVALYRWLILRKELVL